MDGGIFDSKSFAAIEPVDPLAGGPGCMQAERGGSGGGIEGDDHQAGRMVAQEGKLLAGDIQLGIIAAAQMRQTGYGRS